MSLGSDVLRSNLICRANPSSESSPGTACAPSRFPLSCPKVRVLTGRGHRGFRVSCRRAGGGGRIKAKGGADGIPWYEREGLDGSEGLDTSSIYGGDEDREDGKDGIGTGEGEAANEDERLQALASRLRALPLTATRRQFSRAMRSAQLKMTSARVSKLVRILAAHGSWRRATAVVQWIATRDGSQSGPDRYILTTLIAALGKDRPGAVVQVMDLMMSHPSTWPDLASLRAAATALGRAGWLNELLALEARLRKGADKTKPGFNIAGWDGVVLPDVKVFNAILNACAAQRQAGGVRWVLQRMRSDAVRPNAATFGLAIEAMARCQLPDEALSLFEEMEAEGCMANNRTYRALVQALGSVGRVEEAERMVGEMEGRGVQGNAGVYFALASALCAAGRVREGLRSVDKILSFDDAHAPLVTYTGLIRSCAKNKRFDGAIFVFDEMVKMYAPNIVACNVMLTVYGRAGQWERASCLYEEIQSGRVGPRGAIGRRKGGEFRLSPDGQTYDAMLGTCVRCGKWAEARDVAREMARSGYGPSLKRHGWVVDLLLANKQLDFAKELMAEIRADENIPSTSYASGEEISGSQGFPKESNRINNETMALEMSSQATARNPVLGYLRVIFDAFGILDEYTWRYAITSVGAEVNKEIASDVLSTMERWGCFPEAGIYGDLIRGLVKGGNREDVLKAVEILEKMMETGFCPEVGLFTSLIRSCHQHSLYDAVVLIEEQMKKRGFRLNNSVSEIAGVARVMVRDKSYHSPNLLLTQQRMEGEKWLGFESSPSPFEIFEEWSS